jgi:uncharacterized iron-regulated protein
MYKFIFIFILTMTYSYKLLATTQIFDFKNRKYETLDSLTLKLPDNAHYVLGEYHYTDKVQQAQADFIGFMVKTHKNEYAFDVYWEFLNYKDQNEIENKFSLFIDNKITIEQFLSHFNQARGTSYYPILDITKNLNGNFYGVNATRKIKQKIIKNGLGSLNQNDIPPNMSMGSDLYLERFRVAMGGHVDEDQLKAYYIAQCYTDSVMSYYINQFSQHQLSFLVVGSFHSDYGLGTVTALKKLRWKKVISLKFVVKSTLSQTELNELLTPSAKLGQIADYLVLID